MSSDATQRAVRRAFADTAIVQCAYCRELIHPDERGDARAVGHRRTPLSRGGSNRRRNIVVICRRCEHAKGPLTEGEYSLVAHDDIARKALIRKVMTGLRVA